MSTSKSKKKRLAASPALPAPSTTPPIQAQSMLRIEIIRDAQDFQMHTNMLPAGKSETVAGLNTDGVLDLIYQQLAQLAGDCPALPRPEKNAPELRLLPVKEAPPDIKVAPESAVIPEPERAAILHQIRVYQQHSQWAADRDLQPQFPLIVALQVHLPVVPTPENIDIDTPGFGIHLQLTGAELTRPLIHDGCEDIHLGVSDYQRDCTLAPLDPGEYVLAAWVTVPFARVCEKRSVSFRVQAARSVFLTSKLN